MGDEADADPAEPASEPDQPERPAVSDQPDKTESHPNQGAVRAPPDLSVEELDVGWGELPHEPDRLSADDERLLRERPPHWE